MSIQIIYSCLCHRSKYLDMISRKSARIFKIKWTLKKTSYIDQIHTNKEITFALCIMKKPKNIESTFKNKFTIFLEARRLLLLEWEISSYQ